MESFFFVPANRLHKIDAIYELGVDNVVIDLEDAIKSSEIPYYLELLKNVAKKEEVWVRMPIYNLENNLDLTYYKQLLEMGFIKYVFPKLLNNEDFEVLSLNFESLHKNVLLVESALMLVELPGLLKKHHLKIYGVGLGSHDFMNEIGAKHTLENLSFYRHLLLMYAKAYDIKSIDIASMELINETVLADEILDGFEKGFEAKFFIHPWQIAIKDKINFFNLEEYEWAKKIKKVYDEVGNKEEFNPIVVDGEIIEKPHLNRVFAILKYFKNNESK